MAVLPRIPGMVYRRGSLTSKNFTPRAGNDTVGQPGQAPGLSTWETLDLQSGEKAQLIDLSLLAAPLSGIPDDPTEGGVADHVSITPVDGTGSVDQHQLEEWAARRGLIPDHRLTQDVLNAVVRMDVRAGS